MLIDIDKSLNSLKSLLNYFDFVNFWVKIKLEKNGFILCDGSDIVRNSILCMCFFNVFFLFWIGKYLFSRLLFVLNVRMIDSIVLVFKCKIFFNNREEGYW